MTPIFLFIGNKICLNIPNIPCILCSWTPLHFKILKSCVVIRHCMWLWAKETIVIILEKNTYWHQNLAFYRGSGPRPCIYMNQNPLHKIYSVPPFLKQGFPNIGKGLRGDQKFYWRWFFIGWWEQWFWPFEPSSKLKITSCKYWI